MTSISKVLAVAATVAFVVFSVATVQFEPIAAAQTNCPPDVETCIEGPRSVPGHGCQGVTCFSESEICCV
jgi:hypothetical protein